MTTPPIVPEYRDRRTGLILFGIFEILIGLFCSLMIPLMLFARTMASRNPQTHAALAPTGLAMVFYGLLAVAFIWLGVGSILARRWARAIVLCMSVIVLCGGLIGVVAVAFILPHFGEIMAKSSQTPMPPGAILAGEIVMVLVVLFIYIIIPGSIFLFYRSPHVKRTCEVRDPVGRWTDRCPLPVLAISLMMASGGISLFGMAVTLRAFPVFGVLVSGFACVALMFLTAVLLLYLARGMYRLRLNAWWIALACYVIVLISNAITFGRGGWETWYLKMGLDQHTASNSGMILEQPAFKWLMVGSGFLWVAYLLWIRRYFPKQAPAIAAQAGS